jgi:hypothetical protein
MQLSLKGMSYAGLLSREGSEVTDDVATTHSEGSVRIRPRWGLLLRVASARHED